MIDSASIHSPEWAADVWEIFVPPEWPWDSRTISRSDWDSWTSTRECSGRWETLDPFPQRIALMWDDLMVLHGPKLFRNHNEALRAKLLNGWEKRFASALLRLQIEDYPEVDHYLRPIGDVPSSCRDVGMGQVATIQCWRRATCGHEDHSHVDCEFNKREVIPVQPHPTMNYWLAQVLDGEHSFNAVLEAPLRVDLGCDGVAEVCRSQQIFNWSLPCAARKLDRHWHQLAHVIAHAQINDLIFRANRTQR